MGGMLGAAGGSSLSTATPSAGDAWDSTREGREAAEEAAREESERQRQAFGAAADHVNLALRDVRTRACQIGDNAQQGLAVHLMRFAERGQDLLKQLQNPGRTMDAVLVAETESIAQLSQILVDAIDAIPEVGPAYATCYTVLDVALTPVMELMNWSEGNMARAIALMGEAYGSVTAAVAAAAADPEAALDAVMDAREDALQTASDAIADVSESGRSVFRNMR